MVTITSIRMYVQYVQYTSKTMQQRCRSDTRKSGAMCASFLPPCAPHFDVRAAVRRLVKRHNPRIAALFAVKMRRVRRIAARLANLSRAFEIWCSEKEYYVEQQSEISFTCHSIISTLSIDMFCNALFDYDNNTYLNFITDEYQIKIGMIRPNYVHGTNVF